MARKRSSKNVAGHISFKKLSGAAYGENKVYVESIKEDGVIKRPYKIGSKVEWLTPEHAARLQDEIEQHNINAKEAEKRGISTKKKRVVVTDEYGNSKVKFVETTEQETKKEAYERIAKQKKRLLGRITKEGYTQATKAFMAKIDVVANGMSNIIRTNTPENIALRKELEELVSKVNQMTPEQRVKFYEENYELFADMSDYYQWLNRHSGRWDEGDTASSRYEGYSVESYIKKNINSVKKLNKKLDSYV